MSLVFCIKLLNIILITADMRVYSLKTDFYKEVPPDKHSSLFIIPGAEFSPSNSNEKRWEEYHIIENRKIIGKVYLVGRHQNSKGASIIGFHNLIYNIFCGGNADDALKLIG